MLTLKAKRFHTPGNTQLHFTGTKGRSAVLVVPDEEAEPLQKGAEYDLSFVPAGRFSAGASAEAPAEAEHQE